MSRTRPSIRLVLSLFAALFVALWTLPVRAATTITGGNIINQTWTAAGSPYVIQGDVTVPAGAYLTVQAGTTVQFASTDSQASGRNTSKVELTIKGTLTVSGTSSTPVTFAAQSGSSASTWYGIVVESTATGASISNAEIKHAIYGVLNESTGSVLSVVDSTVSSNQYGVYVSAGSPTLTGVTSTQNSYGFYVLGPGSLTLKSSLIYSNTSYGMYLNAPSSQSSTVSVDGSTIDANGSYGIYTYKSSSGTLTLNVTNTIVTNHSSYGIYRYTSYPPTVNITYSDIWNNGNNTNATLGTGAFSCNPLYVSAANRHITSNSPARSVGSAGSDIGALPYTGDATAGNYGVLHSNTTLTAAGSPVHHWRRPDGSEWSDPDARAWGHALLRHDGHHGVR